MRNIRNILASVVILLLAIGILMIYSSSGVYASQELKDPLFFLKRHFIFLGAGFILALVVMSVDYREFRRHAKPWLMITLFLLVAVLVPGIGKVSSGARRWFKLGPINFQPSEMAKITILIYVSDFLARKGPEIKNFWKGFAPVVGVMGVFCLLIVKQPDLGNSVLIASIIFILIFIAGGRLKHMVGLVLLAIPALIVLVASAPYRRARILAFLDPWKDSQGIGFQLTQSQIALGSGGLFGVGPGHSTQKLFYLPAAHTDFILSIIGEEFGLVGTLTVVALFLIFIWQSARIVKRLTDPFGYYLAVGLSSLIGLQAIVNIGVSIGALPTKGLPLPFVSYGGSALIFNMVAVALLLNISRIQDVTNP
jgi:cell division protein FtsW